MTTTNYKALYLSPMIPSFAIRETGIFFQNVLGFTAVLESDSYAIYEKDRLTIHLLPAGQDIGQMEFYLEVDNVDQLWESIKNRLHGLKVKEPFNQTYGMREIHLEVPQTKTLLFIGQTLDSIKPD